MTRRNAALPFCKPAICEEHFLLAIALSRTAGSPFDGVAVGDRANKATNDDGNSVQLRVIHQTNGALNGRPRPFGEDLTEINV